MSYPDWTAVDPETNVIQFYWVSRDSDVSGTLSDFCDVWWIRPVRELLGYRGAFWHTRDVSPDGVSLVGHYGTYPVEQIQTWYRVYPETDIELLVVGRRS